MSKANEIINMFEGDIFAKSADDHIKQHDKLTKEGYSHTKSHTMMSGGMTIQSSNYVKDNDHVNLSSIGKSHPKPHPSNHRNM